MSKVLEMRRKRGEVWDRAKAFLTAHEDANGMLSAEDTEQYERMEKEVVDLGHAIERLERAEEMDRLMDAPTSNALTSRPDKGAPQKPGMWVRFQGEKWDISTLGEYGFKRTYLGLKASIAKGVSG